MGGRVVMGVVLTLSMDCHPSMRREKDAGAGRGVTWGRGGPVKRSAAVTSGDADGEYEGQGRQARQVRDDAALLRGHG